MAIIDTPRISTHPQFLFQSTESIKRKVVLRESMNFINLDGLYLEFGVSWGHTINYISKCLPTKTIYGFDSWQGIPEDWICKGKVFPAGSYSTKGELPKVNENVQLISGMFEDTLPIFVKENSNIPIAYIHIDCDLYSSTKTVFKYIGSMIVPGTVIVFDEYIQDAGEKQAFNEWLEESGLYASVIRSSPQQASFIITSNLNPPDLSNILWSLDPL
jgi:hypothetical protein